MNQKPYVLAALAAILICGYTALSSHAASAGAKTRIAAREQSVARSFVDEFVKADDAALNRRMTANMRTFLSMPVRSKTRADLYDAAGPFVKIIRSEPTTFAGMDTVAMQCQFRKQSLVANVTFDRSLKVTAFTLVPLPVPNEPLVTNKTNRIAPAKSFVTAFLSGQYRQAAAKMSPGMRSMFSPTFSEKLRNEANIQSGRFLAISDAKQTSNSLLDLVNVRCRYQKDDLNAAVVFDHTNQVTAFTLTHWK